MLPNLVVGIEVLTEEAATAAGAETEVDIVEETDGLVTKGGEEELELEEEEEEEISPATTLVSSSSLVEVAVVIVVTAVVDEGTLSAIPTAAEAAMAEAVVAKCPPVH